MGKYPFRKSSLKERAEFYKKEFSIKQVKGWFGKSNLPQLCAIDAGTDSGIIKNKAWKSKLFYFKFSELGNKIKKYAPEDVYYDRNAYKNPNERFNNLQHYDFLADKNIIWQELVIDVDVDNIRCDHKTKDKVCTICLQKCYQDSIKIKNLISKRYNFNNMKLVYSGRGFHIHVFDKKAYKLTKKQRKQIIKSLKKFPIDPWVSAGNIELVRLPYSLHGLVSRITTPLKNKNKFKQIKTIPKFLKTRDN